MPYHGLKAYFYKGGNLNGKAYRSLEAGRPGPQSGEHLKNETDAGGPRRRGPRPAEAGGKPQSQPQRL